MSESVYQKHHLRVGESQMEMNPTDLSNPLSEDYANKLAEAQSQLEKLQEQQLEIEQRKKELEEINQSKDAFLLGQVEVAEKLSTAMTAMDREILSMRQELEELEQTRNLFADHLDKIDKLKPEGWNNESLRQNLKRAISVVDLAEDDYEEALAHFSGSRSGSVFAGDGKLRRGRHNNNEAGLMTQQLKNGLAFNLPIIILAIIALVIYYLKSQS